MSTGANPTADERLKTVLLGLAKGYEAEADVALDCSHVSRHPLESAVLRHVANVLSVLAVALEECAEEGHPGAVEDLAEVCAEWIGTDYVVDLHRLADDGCPHVEPPHPEF